jgi:hypothetical protein
VNLPWRSIVVEFHRAATVDMSDVGVSVSRLLTNSGSVPPVSRNISVTVAGVMLQPFSGAWQVPQCRPFVPCGVKKLLPRSTYPAGWNEAPRPDASGIGRLFGTWSNNRSSSGWRFSLTSGSGGLAHAAATAAPDNIHGMAMCFDNTGCDLR